MPVIDYTKKSVKDSFSGKQLVQVPIGIYAYFWNKIVSKFMPKETYNNAALEIQEDILLQ
jgi:hypothetical protein